jgi:hypothetical protein
VDGSKNSGIKGKMLMDKLNFIEKWMLNKEKYG